MIPAVSIIVPVYNAEAYLQDCLYSIIQQTFPDFELLLIDDGSTDGSVAVINGFTDNRIRVIQNRHDFIGSLNMGIHAARGKYITRMDADDLMLPHRLQTQFDFMELHSDIDVCGSWADTFGEIQSVIRRPTEHADIVSSMLRSNPFMHPTIMMNRCRLLQSGCLYRYGYPCAEDYKLWADLALKDFQFANIPEALIRYRISPQQVTRIAEKEMLVSSAKIALEYAEGVVEKIIEKEERYSDFFNSLIELFNNELLGHDVLLQTIYPVYRNCLINN